MGLVLCKIAYLDIVTHFQVALKGNLTHDTFHQSRLTLTIFTYKGHFLSTLDSQVDIGEYSMRAITLGNLFANDGVIA